MKDAEVIERFGAAKGLAAAFALTTGIELSRSAIYEWKRNGIPHRYRKFLARIAQDQGVELPKGFLDADGQPQPRKAAGKKRNGRRA